MRAVAILERAELIPESVLGSKRIENRELLVAELRRHRQMVTIGMAGVYILAVSVAAVGVWLVQRMGSPSSKAIVPFLGGTAFISLLEFARRLTKDWMLTTLPLVVASHASEKELADLIKQMLVGFGRGKR